MPQNVRNFWLEASIDGSRARIATGPRAKDGGFHLEVKMRDEGSIFTAATLTGDYDEATGGLALRVSDTAGDTVAVVTSRR